MRVVNCTITLMRRTTLSIKMAWLLTPTGIFCDRRQLNNSFDRNRVDHDIGTRLQIIKLQPRLQLCQSSALGITTQNMKRHSPLREPREHIVDMGAARGVLRPTLMTTLMLKGRTKLSTTMRSNDHARTAMLTSRIALQGAGILRRHYSILAPIAT